MKVIYVFYNNDPLALDQGGGAEHFRGLHRALLKSGMKFQMIGTRLQSERSAAHITYISRGANFLRYYLAMWRWFWRHRRSINDSDVFHFHRNYAAWPKLLLCGRRGRVMLSYHNVTGKVLRGRLGWMASPIRQIMLLFERKAVAEADALVCVSNRDRKELGRLVSNKPFADASVIPAAYDSVLFRERETRPPSKELAKKLLVVGRISHQKNIPLAIAVVEALAVQGLEYQLTIAGDGEDARQLIRRIAESPVRDQVRWVGRIPHNQIPDLLRHHGILLLTSRYEASPTIIKEALEAKRPIVTTDVGDVPDWIDQGETGYVCNNTPDDLAKGVIAASDIIMECRYPKEVTSRPPDEDVIMGQVVQLYRRLQAG